jgi:enoyl-CoA hydratase/carnithine racemase
MKLRITHYSPASWHVTFDNPILNLLDPGMIDELRDLINKLENSQRIEGDRLRYC